MNSWIVRNGSVVWECCAHDDTAHQTLYMLYHRTEKAVLLWKIMLNNRQLRSIPGHRRASAGIVLLIKGLKRPMSFLARSVILLPQRWCK